MPCFTQVVVNRQILIDVFVSAASDDKEVAVDMSNNVRALVDTGATHSCITRKAADKLGVMSIDKIPMKTAGGVVEANVYRINLHIPVPISDAVDKDGKKLVNFRHFLKLEVAEANMSDHYDVIIGMDVISAGSLHVSLGHFTFCT